LTTQKVAEKRRRSEQASENELRYLLARKNSSLLDKARQTSFQLFDKMSRKTSFLLWAKAEQSLTRGKTLVPCLARRTISRFREFELNGLKGQKKQLELGSRSSHRKTHTFRLLDKAEM
jgi:hypothetical protein